MPETKNKKMCLQTKQGMSLIELVVLIAIIGIMSAVSIASLVTAKRNSELDTAAEEVMAVLREAQNYSLTGKSISSTCISYMVDFTNGSGNYNLTNGCALNQNYTLKNGVVVFSAIDTTFVAPHGDNSVPGSWRVITVSKGGTNIYVCINSAGLIKKSGNPFCT